ncbi:MAG TPA: PVC-type heme-binding CxxCH protein, partial [Isosphaeraceae bacterium]|nr:PVC-type heme-binding CxxCH protein [Isosphaeraceae bacterium]
PPKSPSDALKTFETIDGFHLELVAAEPLLASPVAAAFDENGNLYVAEMRDYPYHPRPGQPPLGTIRLLRDNDGDGTFDRASVFAEGLLWAAGVTPWKGGVFVTAPPDLWYLKDTDGDGKADLRKKIFTGFGTENEQGILNNLAFGLDHKIYGSSSINGGLVRPGDRPDTQPVDVKGKDFRFDPAGGAFEAITGTVQFGNTFDDWGNRFLCSESRPLLHEVLPLEYLARNPYLAVPAAIENVAGAPVPIYRISPLELWRQIRSSRRIAHGERSAQSAGASHHVVDAAAGVTIYRGGAYPPEFYGNAFVCDAQNNLVHRMALEPQGPTFKARRVDDHTEFVRSYDNWFRPVNLLNAPDGTLYVLDMSREVIEAIHIPLDVVKHLDLRRGRNQGRIYRIAPRGFRAPSPPRLGSASTLELVAALDSPHGWVRDTAHRLLYEHQDRAAIEPLRKLLSTSANPQARVLALWSLHGLKALADADLAAGLADSSEGVRANTVRLAESQLDSARVLLDRVRALAADPTPRVRFQVAFSLGQTHDAGAIPSLARIARSDAADRWMRTAVLSSVANTSDRLLGELLKDRGFAESAPGGLMLEQLAQVVGVRNRPEEVSSMLASVAACTNTSLQRTLVLGLGRGLRQSGGQLDVEPRTLPDKATRHFVEQLLFKASVTAQDPVAAEPLRLQAIEILACARFSSQRQTLVALLAPSQTQAVQVRAVRALAGYSDPEIAGILLEHLREFAPAVRSAALEALLARETWTLIFLRAAQEGKVGATEVEPTRRSLLLRHKNPSIAALAQTLFGAEQTGDRNEVLSRYQLSLKLSGNPDQGTKVFKAHCATCHKLADIGYTVGPDLSASQYRDPAALLTHILDPNRYVPPNYIQYTVADRTGRVSTGLIAAETASSLTLRRNDGAEDTILRTNIDELSSTGKSLMPDDFEKRISPQDMADLLAFLLGSQGPAAAGQERLDIGTLPGLIEPEP